MMAKKGIKSNLKCSQKFKPKSPDFRNVPCNVSTTHEKLMTFYLIVVQQRGSPSGHKSSESSPSRVSSDFSQPSSLDDILRECLLLEKITKNDSLP